MLIIVDVVDNYDKYAMIDAVIDLACNKGNPIVLSDSYVQI